MSKNTTRVYLIRRPKRSGSGSLHYWTLRWTDSKGRERSESIGRTDEVSKTAARKILRDKIAALGSGTSSRDKPAKLTVAEFLRLDREAIATDVKPATLVTHRQATDHLVAAVGCTMLASFDWRHVGRLKAWLADVHKLNGKKLLGCRRATIRKSLATLRAAWNRGKKRGLITSNPFADEKLPKTQPSGKRIYSTEEVAAMVEAAPDIWWRAFIRLAFTSGLRVGELLNSMWSDLDRGHVVVSAKRSGSFEVGGVAYPVLPWSCKSHRERRVPLDPEAANLLDQLRLRSGGSWYLFLGLTRLRALKATRDLSAELPASHLVNNMRRTFQAIQARARSILAERRGVDLDEVEWRTGTMHDLRKSYATHVARRVPMHELQRLMGHASITTTAEHYTEAGRDVAEAVRLAFAS